MPSSSVYICRERESDSMTGLVTALPLLLRGALLGLTRTQRTSTSLPNSLPLAKLFPLSLACSRRLHSVSSSSSPAANSSTTSVILSHGETSGTRGLDVSDWFVTGTQQRICHAAAADGAMNTTISSSKVGHSNFCVHLCSDLESMRTGFNSYTEA